VLSPVATMIEAYEAHEMTRLLEELQRPYGRDHGEPVRAGREGTYRQAADGLIFRLSAAEGPMEAEAAARTLFALACREACGGQVAGR